METEVFSGFPTHLETTGQLLKICLQKYHKLGTFVQNYLRENLHEIKSSRFIPKREKLIPGTVGIGQFEGQYYRIQILEHTQLVCISDIQISVLLIDYGNVASLTLNDIRLLNYEVHKALLNIPALAITCYLENVWVTRPWNEDELNTLKERVLYKVNQCIVRKLHPKFKVLNIFFDSDSKILSELILVNKLASPISDADLLNTGKRIESITDERPQSLAHHSFNAPLEYMIQSSPRGKDLKITVCHIESPSMFFIQYNSKLHLLNDIQEAVTNYCKHQPRVKDMKGLKIGSPVAVLFEGKVWYRAMILSLGNESAQISYVDYGIKCEVFMSHLCKISKNLVTKWETQAVECCLKGFENDNDNKTSEEEIAHMEETLNKTYNMKPIKILSTNRLLVELIDEDGNKISEKIMPETNLSWFFSM